jgi:predicted nucleotidyltransferase
MELTTNAILQGILAEQPYPLLFVTISGAHLYGFPSLDSDYDLRGVHILPMNAIFGLEELQETIEDERIVDGLELDVVSYDVKTFFQLLLKKSGNVLEGIVSPLVLQTSPEHEELKAILPMTLSPHHAHHYLGFSKRKWTDFLKEGRTAKALLYTYRTLLTGIHLMKTGEVEANLNHLNAIYKLPYVPDLVAAKLEGGEKGALKDADIPFHESEYERLTKVLEEAQETTHLPFNPAGRDELNDLLIRIRHKYGQ